MHYSSARFKNGCRVCNRQSDTLIFDKFIETGCIHSITSIQLNGFDELSAYVGILTRHSCLVVTDAHTIVKIFPIVNFSVRSAHATILKKVLI